MSISERLLTDIFLLGLFAGLLLALWSIYLYWISRRHKNRQLTRKKEQEALNALEEQPIEIDDEGMICAHCWEDRHPGQLWSLRRRILCVKHLLQNDQGDTSRQDKHTQTYALQH